MRLVLTGATGYVGKHVLARLLANGHVVTVIARAGSRGPRARVLTALRPFAKSLPTNWERQLDVIRGDVARPDCEIELLDRHRLLEYGVDGFIHCAGLTRFDEHLKDELFATNLCGTQHALALSERLACPRFHHVSTAFVAGTSTMPFGAGHLSCGQGFNNPYESSKFAAEAFLHTESQQNTRTIVIYRPTIVVGGFPIGEGNAVSTVYTFLKAMHFLRACCRRDTERGGTRFAQHGLHESAAGFHMPIRIAADPDTPLYLISIDDLVDTLVAHLAGDMAPITTLQLSGDAYPLSLLRDTFCAAMRITGPTLVRPEMFERTPRNAVEEHFFRLTRSYQAYLLSAPQFSSPSMRPTTKIDLGILARRFLGQLADTQAVKGAAEVGAMAVDLRGISRARDYFDGLTRRDIGRHFLKRHRFVDAAIRFRIHGDDPFDEVIVFKNAQASYASANEREHYDCCYELDEGLLLQVITGQTDLRKAFFAGRVSIEGDKETALKFGSLLSQYYRDIEDNVIQEIAV